MTDIEFVIKIVIMMQGCIDKPDFFIDYYTCKKCHRITNVTPCLCVSEKKSRAVGNRMTQRECVVCNDGACQESRAKNESDSELSI